MANETPQQLLDKAQAAARLAQRSRRRRRRAMPTSSPARAGAAAHAATGGAIDPFVFRSPSSCWRSSSATTWSGR